MITSPCPPRKAMKKGGIQAGGGQHIKVFVRVRPMNKIEKECKAHCLIECPNSKDVVVQERANDKLSKKFTFDKVFNSDSKQSDVYRAVAKPLVDEVLNGFNCTIFAYGQTGTGKTFTMEGDGQLLNEDNPSTGIIPRCVNHLFDELRFQKLEFTMRVSFLELYNEELFDLLSAHDDLSKLRIYEDCTRRGSCIIQGLEEVLVRCKADVYNIIEKGSAKRQTAATMLNAHSSRSHTVFTVTVHIKENVLDGDELLKTGKLHLVDLAGSENIGRSGAVDKRAREAGSINQSLLTLGRVITSLVEKTPHIPYRESKLTRLLQDALGGRTKTSIIATISPAHINLEETLSTLDYAHRAKNIQNKPEVNQKLNKKELIGEYTIEIDRLRRDLLAMREKNGVYLANENYQEMIATQDQQEQEIAEKIAQIRALEEEIEKNTEVFNEVNKILTETTEKLCTTETSLLSTKNTLECTQKLLSQTAAEREEQKYLVKAHCKVEEKLHNEGNNIINTAQLASSDISKLHDKLDRKRKVECLNSEIEKTFNEDHDEKISQMELTLMEMKKYNQENIEVISEDIKNSVSRTHEELKNIIAEEKQISHNCSVECQSLNTEVHCMLDKFNNFEGLDNLRKRCVTEMEKLNAFKVDTFNPRIIQISDCTTQQSKDITDLVEHMEENVKTLEKHCQNAYEEHSTLISNIDTDVRTMIELEDMETKSLRSRNQKEEKEINEELNLNNEILWQLETQMDQAKGQMKEQMAQMDGQMKVKMDAMKICIQEMENQLSVQFKNMNLLMETKFQEINAPLQQIRSNLDSRKDRMIASLQQLTEKKEKKNIKFETISKKLLDNNNNLRDLAMKHCELSGKAAEDIKSYFNSKIHKIECQINNFEEDNNFVATQVCCQISTVLGTLSDAETIASDQISDITKTVDLAKLKSCKLLDTFNCKLTSDLDQQHEYLSNEQCRLTLSIEDICQRLLDHELYIREKLYNHHSELINCREKVKEFLSEQLVKDGVTGMTPVRKEYRFPKVLSRTSPHEKLLERHRTLVRGGSKIPLPSSSYCDYDIDENINISSDANPHESSSFNYESLSSKNNSAVGNIRLPLARSESFKDFVFQEPSAPVMACQESRENMKMPRSSSTSCLDSKENFEITSLRQKQSGSYNKKQLHMPSSSKLQNFDKNANNEIKPRKILGSHN